MKMKLPLTKIHLGHKTYDVADFNREEVASGGHRGFHYGELNRIAINLEHGDSQEEVMVTLIHEIFHAIWDDKVLPLEGEEHLVTALALGWSEVLKRNPKLIKAINDSFTN